MNIFQSMFQPDFSKMTYIPPCESGEFDEHGNATEVYVDRFGNRYKQPTLNEAEEIRKEEWERPFRFTRTNTNMPFYRDTCEPIDVTFEEVKEDEDILHRTSPYNEREHRQC